MDEFNGSTYDTPSGKISREPYEDIDMDQINREHEAISHEKSFAETAFGGARPKTKKLVGEAVYIDEDGNPETRKIELAFGSEDAELEERLKNVKRNRGTGLLHTEKAPSGGDDLSHLVTTDAEAKNLGYLSGAEQLIELERVKHFIKTRCPKAKFDGEMRIRFTLEKLLL